MVLNRREWNLYFKSSLMQKYSNRNKVLSTLSISEVENAARKEGYYLSVELLKRLANYINKYDTLLDDSLLDIRSEIKNYLNVANIDDIKAIVDSALQNEGVFNLDSDTISKDFITVYYDEFIPNFSQFCKNSDFGGKGFPKNKAQWLEVIEDFEDDNSYNDEINSLNHELDNHLTDLTDTVYGEDHILNLYEGLDINPIDVNRIQREIKDAYIHGEEPEWLDTLRNADKQDLEDAIYSAMQDELETEVIYGYHYPFDRYLANGKLIIECVSMGELEVQVTDTGFPICKELLDLRNNYVKDNWLYINHEGDSVCYTVKVSDVLKYLKGE